MRIAIIGSGSIGCYYGAKLVRAGHDVHFLMRRDLEAVRENGLQIHSIDGDLHLDGLQVYADSAEIGPVDWVICALKATSMDVAERLIRPCAGPDTRIIVLMNGLGLEEKFALSFDPRRILGGMAFVCINRGEPGVLYHLGYGRLTFGHYEDDAEETAAVVDVFRKAGLDAQARPSLRQARWEKLMWNIPFSTLAITAGGVPTDEVINDPGLNDLARRLMKETGETGNADGSSIEIPTMIDKMMKNTSTMGAYRPSMLVDYEYRQPLEVEAILGEPVRRANELGVAVPLMETQYYLTSYLDRRNRKSSR